MRKVLSQRSRRTAANSSIPKLPSITGVLLKRRAMVHWSSSLVQSMRFAAPWKSQTMVERNADIPDDRRIDFRVGINVGDIVIDEGDIFGDGVNVAARLESIAERGGVIISRQVLDQIEEEFPSPVASLVGRTSRTLRGLLRFTRSVNDEDRPAQHFSRPRTFTRRSGTLMQRTMFAWLTRRSEQDHP